MWVRTELAKHSHLPQDLHNQKEATRRIHQHNEKAWIIVLVQTDLPQTVQPKLKLNLDSHLLAVHQTLLAIACTARVARSVVTLLKLMLLIWVTIEWEESLQSVRAARAKTTLKQGRIQERETVLRTTLKWFSKNHEREDKYHKRRCKRLV